MTVIIGQIGVIFLGNHKFAIKNGGSCLRFFLHLPPPRGGVGRGWSWVSLDVPCQNKQLLYPFHLIRCVVFEIFDRLKWAILYIVSGHFLKTILFFLSYKILITNVCYREQCFGCYAILSSGSIM